MTTTRSRLWIAGAGPETDEKGNPVGLVYFGCARRGLKPFHKRCELGNLGRSAVRYAAATEALLILATCLEHQMPGVRRHCPGRLGFQYDFDATILSIAELPVKFRTLFKSACMSHDERGVDLTINDAIEQ